VGVTHSDKFLLVGDSAQETFVVVARPRHSRDSRASIWQSAALRSFLAVVNHSLSAAA